MRVFLAFATATLILAGPAIAGGGTCLPSCDVLGQLMAFVPPVTELERGSTVRWDSLDVGHTATDPSDAFCFSTDFTVSLRGEAFFTIFEGKLYAVSDVAGGELVECSEATALPDGSFVLEYFCAFHPRMEGQLVIR